MPESHAIAESTSASLALRDAFFFDTFRLSTISLRNWRTLASSFCTELATSCSVVSVVAWPIVVLSEIGTREDSHTELQNTIPAIAEPRPSLLVPMFGDSTERLFRNRRSGKLVKRGQLSLPPRATTIGS